VVRSDLSAETLFSSLSRSFAQHFETWRNARASGAGDPFLTVRSEWLARAAGVGGTVSVKLPSGERRGAFMGLDPNGRLQLRTSVGTELIDAGDLFFPAFSAETYAVSQASR
jgi:BirA family biotin operon repressor/biotin-[acetyl-CoA-carboxylase] ligase